MFLQTPSSRCEHAAAIDDGDGGRVQRRRDGNDSGCSFRYGIAFCMNAFQISAGNVPPATGWPWNWYVIGTSLSG